MKTIALDEAGYTGSDLMNIEQPVFSLASVNFSSKEADELLSCITTNADEYKFTRLRKLPKFKRELHNFLNHELISADTVQVSIAHKEYLVIAHTVDRILEPVMAKDGFDLYAEGANIGMTNMLYYNLHAQCNKRELRKYGECFVRFFKNKDLESKQDFYDSVFTLYENYPDNQVKMILGTIYDTYNIADDILENVDKFTLDSTTPCFAVMVNHWGRIFETRFNAIMDASKPLEHFSWLFDSLKSMELEEKEVGYGSRKFLLPLKLEDLKFEDSKNFKQIQIADIIAGASAHFGKSLVLKENNPLSDIIWNSNLQKTISGIWPSTAITPEQLNMDKSGTNPLDGMADAIRKW